MKIEAAREGGSTVLRLGGRLDREWAEHLSHTLEDLLREGVRSLVIDLSAVTYVSSAAIEVLAYRQQELAALRGDVRLTSIPPAIRETFTIAGWDARPDAAGATAARSADLRKSSWQLPALAVKSGQYQTATSTPDGRLTCHLHGQPNRLTQQPVGPEDCAAVTFPADGFGIGLGAIGGSYEACHERLGELIGVAGCLAYFPTDGARLADYLVAEGPVPPRAVLASGITCRGAFAKLVRFSPRTETEAVPLSEIASVCLDASGGGLAGLVIAGEAAGLTGARLRRSPAGSGASPVRFEVPAVREWLSFAPERTYALTTALIAGVVARAPEGPLAAYLRPLGNGGRLFGHLHAAVFSYRPLPQRTVELGTLVKGFFTDHQLRDVLHLVWDDRDEAGVEESMLLRGVGWVAPITQTS
jgi:anti-anti-sigma factor